MDGSSPLLEIIGLRYYLYLISLYMDIVPRYKISVKYSWKKSVTGMENCGIRS